MYDLTQYQDVQKRSRQYVWSRGLSILALGIIILALLCGFTADAHHSRQHRVLVRGEMSGIHTIACDTEDQVASIIKAHMNGGAQLSQRIYMLYAQLQNDKGESICSKQDYWMTPKKIVAAFQLDVATFIVEVDVEGDTLYILTDIPLVEPGQGI